MPLKIAYFGPAGTYTEAVARRYAPDADFVPYPTIVAVGAAVVSGEVQQGVVPIENSLQGAVPETLDLLIQDHHLHVRRELTLAVEHCLMVKPGVSVNDIKRVYSHPQALAQCLGYLGRRFPNIEKVAAMSTAAAVEEAKNAPVPSAAIAPRRAAEIYGAEIVDEGIQDRANNVTRFVVLALEDHQPTGRDKTAICFSFLQDRSGLLYDVLKEFAVRNINLTKIESRPSKESLGKYIFLVDMEGHKEDAIVAEALARVQQLASMYRVFGSFPRYDAPDPEASAST